MSTRAVLQSVIDANVYDNNNKEILAEMLRTVFESIMNADFNKADDQLQNLKYNATQTLSQFFSTLPVIRTATIGPFDVAGGSFPVAVSGVATSAYHGNIGSGAGILDISFLPEVNISNKMIMITYSMDNPTNSRMFDHCNIASPVYGVNSPTSIRVVVKENIRRLQSIYLRLFII